MFGKATTNSELDQSLLLVHLHFFSLLVFAEPYFIIYMYSQTMPSPFPRPTVISEVLKKVGSVANNLGNNLDLPVPFDNQVDLFFPFDNQVD